MDPADDVPDGVGVLEERFESSRIFADDRTVPQALFVPIGAALLAEEVQLVTELGEKFAVAGAAATLASAVADPAGTRRGRRAVARFVPSHVG